MNPISDPPQKNGGPLEFKGSLGSPGRSKVILGTPILRRRWNRARGAAWGRFGGAMGGFGDPHLEEEVQQGKGSSVGKVLGSQWGFGGSPWWFWGHYLEKEVE